MNAQITELVDQLPIASDVAKSIGNRLESALIKTGSAQSRLKMASQSMNALASKYDADTDENGYADLFARIFAIASLVGVDNKKDSAKPSTKTTRENWHDADSVEAKAITSKTSKPKPRKNKSVANDEYTGTMPTRAEFGAIWNLLTELRQEAGR
jgi:hypothetical protein